MGFGLRATDTVGKLESFERRTNVGFGLFMGLTGSKKSFNRQVKLLASLLQYSLE